MESTSAVILLYFTLLCERFTESFLVSDGKCFHDFDCGLGQCDIDNRCRCYLGWKGDSCGEHDDLALGTTLNTCDHFICQHGACHSYGGERKCICDSYWSGLVCDIPSSRHVNAVTTTSTSIHMTKERCGNHDCYHGRCGYGYLCHCDHGWSDYQCNTDENICNHNNCVHGDCLNSKCDCHMGWSGSTCNVKSHEYECDGQPCHHGNCEWKSGGRQYCRCLYGWTGHDCNTQEAVTHSHCGSGQHRILCHHGKCSYQGYNRYTCQCYPGWRGSSCSIIDVKCSGTFCFHGVCHNDVTKSDFYCICDDGWTGKDCNKRETHSTSTSSIASTSTTTSATTVKTTSTTSSIISSVMPQTERTSIHSTSKSLGTSNQPSTTAPSTTSSTTIISSHSTTSLPAKTFLKASVCSKLSTVSDIANVQISTNQNAVSCVSGNKSSPEALVLTHCNLTSPTKWKEGINVMKDCSSIKPYTPIATFGNHHYSSAGTLCGIFVGCLQNGFQMAVQYCDQPPSIEHVETNNGLFADDPTTYFTIME